MVTVNPDRPEVVPQDTIRASQGSIAAPGVSSGFASLFSGAVNVGTQAVKAVDFMVDKAFRHEGDEGLARINEEANNLSRGVTNTGLNTQITTNTPQQLKSGLEEIDKLGRAKNAGQLINTAYWARVQKLVGDLKSRYPGYGDDIDNFMQAQTGAVPANALRRALVQQVNSHTSANQTETIRQDKFVTNNAEIAGVQLVKQLRDNKISFAKFQDDVNIKKGLVGDRLEAKNALGRSKIEAVDSATASATAGVHIGLGEGLFDVFGTNIAGEMFSIIVGMNNGKTSGLLAVDAGNLSQAAQAITAFEVKMAANVNAAIDEFANDSQGRVLIDADARKKIVDNAMFEFRQIRDILTGKTDISLFNRSAMNVKNIKSMATQKLLGMPNSLAWATVRSELGEPIAASLLAKDGGASAIIKEVQSIQFDTMKMNLFAAASKEIKNPTGVAISVPPQLVTRMRDELGITDPKVFKAAIDKLASIHELVDKGDDEDVGRLFTAVYTDDDGALLKQFNVEDRIKIATTMASPKAFAAIKRLSSTQPHLMTMYGKYVRSQFRVIAKGSISGFKKFASERGGSMVYNTSTGLFDIVDVPKSTTSTLTLAGAAPFHTQTTDTGRREVDDMNTAMRFLAPLIDNEGTDKTNEIKKLLNDIGIGTNEIKFIDGKEGPGTKDTVFVPPTEEEKQQAKTFGGARIGGATFGGAKYGGLTPKEIFAGTNEELKDKVVAEVKAPTNPTTNSPSVPDSDVAHLAKFEYDANLDLPSDSLVQKIHQKESVDLDRPETEEEILAAGFTYTIVGKELGDITGSIVTPEDTIGIKIRSLEKKDQEALRKRTDLVKGVADAVGNVEAPLGYNQIYGKNQTRDLTNMNMKEVLALQRTMLKNGSASSAVGKYQAIRGTLAEFISKYGIKPTQKFTPEFQDYFFAVKLEEAGLSAFRTGKMSKDKFSTNFARIWASLPVLKNLTTHDGRKIKKGQSYYVGDGLNKALMTTEAYEKLLKDLSF